MANWFNRSLPIPKVKHSVFDMSNDYKTSINMGALYPNYVEECVPSDKFKNLRHEIFLRFAPMTFPIMHRVKVRQNSFFVPLRLIIGDKNYEYFLNNERDLPALNLVCGLSSGWNLKNTIFDYLGYQVGTMAQNSNWYIPNPVAFLSYLLIWKVWYSDEQLDSNLIASIDSIIEDYRECMEDGIVFTLNINTESDRNIFRILPVSYTKDYFTAAQPQPQRGDDVLLMSPLKTTYSGATAAPVLVSGSGGTNPGVFYVENGSSFSALSSSLSIRDLWQKEQLQRFLDVDNIYGTKPHEKLAGHWGVISSDARIQLPRYIGGGESIVQIQEVTQLSADTETSPLGALAGKATSFSKTHKLSYFCEEHGFCISLMSIVPDNGYMTGNPRYFYKKNILDFASPEFNNIGYQAVYKGEIYSNPTATNTTDLEEFAYQPRYSEYRVHRSIATGDFRDSLKAWHLNRAFTSLPPFNSSFIHVNQTDSARIFNNTSVNDQHIYVDVYTDCTMSRPISYMPSSMHL